MIKQKKLNQQRQLRHNRVRAKISGTISIPRLSIFRSNTGMYVQLIDDQNSKTIASVSNKEIKKKDTKVKIAKELGLLIAKKAKEKKISKIVFDRGSYKYHGRVKALAEGAREGGLQF